MEIRPVASGVGLLTGRIADTFPQIESFFPLPDDNPKMFSTVLYPKYTDTLFVRTIYQLTGRDITISELARTASYHRMNRNDLERLISNDVDDVIYDLEPRFFNHPEILTNFKNAAKRYATEPFPIFEIDFVYGEADIYHKGKLIEMKSYSVMTRQDLILARNQVLLYACLSRHIGNLQGPIKQIEVINALTNEVWTWDFEKFAKTGEADRFYWSVIVPLIGNNDVTDEDIACVRNLYEANIVGLDIFSKILRDKYNKPLCNLQRKLKEQEKQLKLESDYRHMIITHRREPGQCRRGEQWEIDYECLQRLFI